MRAARITLGRASFRKPSAIIVVADGARFYFALTSTLLLFAPSSLLSITPILTTVGATAGGKIHMRARRRRKAPETASFPPFPEYLNQ